MKPAKKSAARRPAQNSLDFMIRLPYLVRCYERNKYEFAKAGARFDAARWHDDCHRLDDRIGYFHYLVRVVKISWFAWLVVGGLGARRRDDHHRSAVLR